MNKGNISNELMIQPWNGGIRLINPAHLMLPTVADVCEQPFDVFFLDLDFQNKKVNRSDAEACGFDSEESAIGKTVYNYCEKKFAKIVTETDEEVLSSRKPSIYECDFYSKNGDVRRNCLTFRFPWFNEDFNIIGLLGFNIRIGKQPLAESLAYIQSLGLLNKTYDSSVSNFSNSNNFESHFSKREMDVVRLLIKGKTAKEMGRMLGLSYRTIQHYLDNIKCKMKVSSKSDLIEKIIGTFSEIYR